MSSSKRTEAYMYLLNTQESINDTTGWIQKLSTYKESCLSTSAFPITKSAHSSWSWIKWQLGIDDCDSAHRIWCPRATFGRKPKLWFVITRWFCLSSILNREYYTATHFSYFHVSRAGEISSFISHMLRSSYLWMPFWMTFLAAIECCVEHNGSTFTIVQT